MLHMLSKNKNKDVSNLNQLYYVLRKMILRAESYTVPQPLPQPCTVDVNKMNVPYKIGFSCNVANNAYIYCKIARKKGIDATLFYEPDFTDFFILSNPAWEDIDFEVDEVPKTNSEFPQWTKPEYVKVVKWNQEYTMHLLPDFDYVRINSIFNGTNIKINDNDVLSYLLNYEILPHRDMLYMFNSVDVLHVSGYQIGIASFSEKPYVTFPYGSDLYALPFEDSERGWMQVRGFRNASRHIVSGEIMMDFMRQLGVPRSKIDLLPFMIDTDEYAPLLENNQKKESKKQFKEKDILFLIGARQNWVWKGSDKLMKAISNIKDKLCGAIFLIVWYGQDLDKTGILMKELGIEHLFVKIGILSKGRLRKMIDTVDVCLDQFTHGGLGTFSLESMSMSKPLITYYNSDKHFKFDSDPPVLNAFSVDEISEQIMYCVKNYESLEELGKQSRAWIKNYHGCDKLWPEYDSVYKKAIIDLKYRQ